MNTIRTIINKLQALPDKIVLSIFILSVCAYMLVLGMQGLGMVDEGWEMTAYQQVFSHPQSVSYNFLYYNGVIEGGIWNLLFGNFGIFSFRVMNALVEVLRALMVWLILRKYINRFSIIVGYFILLFCTTWIGYISHNYLTSLLSLCVIYFIFKALTEDKLYYIFVAGLFAGINLFTRIPNVVQLFVFLIIIPYYCYTKNLRKSIKLFSVAVLGGLVGISLELAFMMSVGHFDIFWDNIVSGFAASSDNDSTHNLTRMFGVYWTQLMEVLLYSGLFMILPMLWQIIDDTYKKKWFLGGLFFLWCVTCIHFVGISSYQRLLTSSFVVVLLYALLRDIHINSKITQERGYLIILSLLSFILMPLGSDWGYDASITLDASRLSVPLCVGLVYDFFKSSKFQMPRYVFATCVSIMLVIITFSGIYSVSLTTGEEDGSRLKKIYKVDSELATVYTRKESVEALNPLLHELSNYVKPNDTLLCFQSLALVHYLTQTQPYIENPWPWTYTSGEMERHFEKALKNSKFLPVIVREKSSVVVGWRTPFKDWDNSNAEENRYHKNKKIKLIQDFINNNNYVVAWENDIFQILIPM